MAKEGDFDHREEGESLFEWPLTDESRLMSPGDLLDELLETITRLNHMPAWPLTLLPPRLGDVVIDRERRSIGAILMWKRKSVRGGE